MPVIQKEEEEEKEKEREREERMSHSFLRGLPLSVQSIFL
jgi:hypothetical protein